MRVDLIQSQESREQFAYVTACPVLSNFHHHQFNDMSYGSMVSREGDMNMTPSL